ncbi:MAG: isoamylase early set domain-containing protein [Gemmatimonadaceae bacterium]|nr:isoamylase early set domain-containing protein [Gemmatimonadaceae bacterium]
MPDPMDDLDQRLSRALHAMQDVPPFPREAADRIAARAILASSPQARAGAWTRRLAAAVVLMAAGAAVVTAARRTAVVQRSELAMAGARAVGGAPVLPAAGAPLLPVSAGGARPIIFELDAPDARSVQVLGDFNHWSRDATAMERSADGRWRITTLLPPGRYIYAYLVDGHRFERDPARDAVEDRDFGVTGSELVVGEAP